MAKGTDKYCIRIPHALAAECRKAIKERNERTANAEWSLSDFVRDALREKIMKLERGRGKKARKLLITNDGKLDCVQEMF